MKTNLWKENVPMAKTISFVKGKGSLRHNNREFIANNIDEARVPWNIIYIHKPLQEAYEEIFGTAVSEYNAKQKRSDRKIDDYLTKIKNSGNNENSFMRQLFRSVSEMIQACLMKMEICLRQQRLPEKSWMNTRGHFRKEIRI